MGGVPNFYPCEKFDPVQLLLHYDLVVVTFNNENLTLRWWYSYFFIPDGILFDFSNG